MQQSQTPEDKEPFEFELEYLHEQIARGNFTHHGVDETKGHLIEIDDEMESCIDCLELIDRVRRHQIQQEMLEKLGSHSFANEVLPRQIGRFLIIRELGRGGAGIVLLANDSKLRRKVAIKLPHCQFLIHDQLRSRFIREAEIVARLDHPHIVRIHEVGEEGPLCYLATEFCDGPNLSEWRIKQTQPFSPRVAATIIRDLALAVQHAHAQAIIHRDIKPSNILVVGEKLEAGLKTPDVKLCDFGLAKVLDEEIEQTRTGDLIGTPAYMSPEQAEGKLREIDTRTDIYALGIILYELLAGKPPFDGESRPAILLKVVRDEPTSLRSIRRDVPLDLAVIVHKAIAKSKGDRYPTALALADDLDRWLEGKPIQARPVGWSEYLIKWTRRRPYAAASFTIVVLSLIGLLVTLGVTNTRVRKSLADVQQARQEAIDEAARTKVFLYAADVRYAAEAFERDSSDVARETLAKYIPTEGESDLRTWPWFYLWNQLKKPGIPIEGNTLPVVDLEFSPDGKQIATALKLGKVAVWDAEKRKILWQATSHFGDATAVRYSPASGRLWTCGDDGFIKEWQSDQKSRVVSRITPGVKEMTFSNDGKLIATGNEWGQVTVVDAETGKIVKLLRAHALVSAVVDFSPDNRWLMTASEDGFVRLWSTKDYHLVSELKFPSKIISGEFSPDSKRIVVALRQLSETAVIDVLENEQFEDLPSEDFVQSISPPAGLRIGISALSADGSTICGDLISNQSTTAFRWSESKGIEKLAGIQSNKGNSHARGVSADGRIIVGQSESPEGPVAVYWTAPNEIKNLGEVKGGTYFSDAVGITSDGSLIFGNSTNDTKLDGVVWTTDDSSIHTYKGPEDLSRTISLVSGLGHSAFSISENEDGPTLRKIDQDFKIKDFACPRGWLDLELRAISEDGSSVTGRCTVDNHRKNFRWSKQFGFEILVLNQKYLIDFEPCGLSSTGDMVLGRAIQEDGSSKAAILGLSSDNQQLVRGFRYVEDLAQDLGLGSPFQGKKVETAVAISRDQHTLIGSGVESNGDPSNWILKIPKKSDLNRTKAIRVSLEESRRVSNFKWTTLSVRWLDNERYAVGGIRGDLSIVDSTTGFVAYRRIVTSDRISTIAKQPTSMEFAVGVGNGEIDLFNSSIFQSNKKRSRRNVRTNIVCPSPDGESLIVSYSDGSVELINDLEGSTQHSEIQAYFDDFTDVSTMVPSPDGMLYAFVSAAHVYVFDKASKKLITKFETDTDSPPILWFPDSRRIATTTSVIQIRDVSTGQLVNKLGDGSSRFRYSLAITPDGKTLACAKGNDIELWDLSNNKLKGKLSGHSAGIRSLAFSPDGTILASGSLDHTIRLWDVKTHESKGVLIGHQMGIESVVWFDDLKSLASTDYSGRVFIWDLSTRQYVLSRQFNRVTRIAVLNKTNSLVVCDSNGGAIELWHADPN